MVKIFLDDIRNPVDCLGYMHTRIGAANPIYLEEWVIVRNYEEFAEAIDEHYPYISHVSFDHDLADEHYLDVSLWDKEGEYEKLYPSFKEKTGLDCARFLKEYYIKENDRDLPIMYVHSMNPVGTQNIINLF